MKQKLKRILALILALSISLSMLSTTVFAKNEQASDVPAASEHHWDEGETTSAPTCFREGEKTYHCTDKGCTETKVEAVAMLEHSWNEGEITTAPTCTKKGVKTYTCVNEGCTQVRTENVAALGHVWDEGTMTKDPTCTETGVRTQTCTRCGSTLPETVPADGHKYETVVKEATCEEDGSKTMTCTVCGDTATEVIPALSHSYEKGEIIVAPTCTEEGTQTIVCTRCGDISDISVPATGHTEEAVITEPTCTEKGFTTYTCTVCDAVRVDDETEALGHDWDEGEITTAPTCTEVGVKTLHCTRCDAAMEEEVPAVGHTEEAVVTAPTCTEKGYTTYTCTVCAAVRVDDETEELGHSWDDGVADPSNENDRIFTCTVCGEQARLARIALNTCTVTLAKSSVTYNGKEQAPVVKVVDTSMVADGYELREGVDYDIVAAESFVKPGTYTIKLIGKNNYKGETSVDYTIAKIKLSTRTITLEKTAYTYTGKAIKPAVSVKNKDASVSTKNYTVTYSNNTKVGTATVTVKGKNNYTGTVKLTFKINPKKTTLSSVSNASGKKLTVKWKKNTTGTGYQIQYSTDKAFKKSVTTKTVKKNTTVSATYSGLTKGKTYYVRIRTYKTVSDNKYYSGWSSAKSVKISK